VGHNADAGQRPVEALTRPAAPRDRLVDPRGEQELGRDLSRPLGQADLIARHAGPALALPTHPRGVDGVRQAVLPFQRVDDVRAAPLLVAVADRLAVEVDARRHDMHMVLGVRHDDVGHIVEAHALQVIPRERGPVRIVQALTRGQAEGAMVDNPRQITVEPAHITERASQLARRRAVHVAPHDARRAVL